MPNGMAGKAYLALLTWSG